MTQLSILSSQMNWGLIHEDLDEAKVVLQDVREKSRALVAETVRLDLSICDLNDARRRRVLDLLLNEGRVICLFHATAFPDQDVEEWLVPKDKASVVHIMKSWRESHRCYDGDPDYTTERKQYTTIVCDTCCALVTHGSLTDKNGVTRRLLRADAKQDQDRFESLYSTEVVDTVSEKYYQMSPITRDNLDSL